MCSSIQIFRRPQGPRCPTSRCGAGTASSAGRLTNNTNNSRQQIVILLLIILILLLIRILLILLIILIILDSSNNNCHSNNNVNDNETDFSVWSRDSILSQVSSAQFRLGQFQISFSLCLHILYSLQLQSDFSVWSRDNILDNYM